MKKWDLLRFGLLVLLFDFAQKILDPYSSNAELRLCNPNLSLREILAGLIPFKLAEITSQFCSFWTQKRQINFKSFVRWGLSWNFCFRAIAVRYFCRWYLGDEGGRTEAPLCHIFSLRKWLSLVGEDCAACGNFPRRVRLLYPWLRT